MKWSASFLGASQGDFWTVNINKYHLIKHFQLNVPMLCPRNLLILAMPLKEQVSRSSTVRIRLIVLYCCEVTVCLQTVPLQRTHPHVIDPPLYILMCGKGWLIGMAWLMNCMCGGFSLQLNQHASLICHAMTQSNCYLHVFSIRTCTYNFCWIFI